MSERGGTSDREAESPTGLHLGQTLYDEDGNPVGEIRGLEEDGAYLTTREGPGKLSVEHVRAGGGFGEAEIVWQCMECGEMGYIDEELPETCPNCGVGKENLRYWTED